MKSRHSLFLFATLCVRFLKKAAGFGQLDLLTAELVPAHAASAARFIRDNDAGWDPEKFASSCAGCHTTQLDSRSRKFSTASLDCYVCHGAATLDHSKDTSLMLLAKKRKDLARVVVFICSGCHLRGGRSKSTGLPFPNNFVAGGDLFTDFEVNWSLADDPQLNPGDRHVYQNARDVIVLGKTAATCLTCHSMHGQSTAAHHRLPNSDTCLNCHNHSGPKSTRKPYERHSPVCAY